MGLSFHLFFFMRLLFILSLLHLILSHSSHFVQSRCHDNERSALWQFKENFIITKAASHDPLAYPKVVNWTFEGETSDCCSWDGVECDENSGRVIGLDLRSSYLYGSIHSNSSLFDLVNLRRLNLADNHFNYSPIPSQVRNLSRLTYLNLTASMFSGNVPLEISQLSQLSALHLCHNYDLELKNPYLESFLANLTHLRGLGMSGVRMSSKIPSILAKFSSLASLYLDNCGLHGKIPIGIFKLPNLQVLYVGDNVGLSGEIPASIGSLYYLTRFRVCNCSLSSSIPSLLGNVTNLIYLDLSQNNLTGEIPSSLGNLTKLIYLGLWQNNLSGEIPSSLGNLTNLIYLGLWQNNLSGEIPSSLGNFTNLISFSLGQNNLIGEIPSLLGNLTNLIYLGLWQNNLSGEIPSSLGNLTNLISLGLGQNNLIGEIPSSLGNLTNLIYLGLWQNNLIGEIPSSLGSLTNLISLVLGQNNLIGEIPSSLGNLTNLIFLGLGQNNLTGKIPSSLWNLTQLKHLVLRENKFHGHIPNSVFNLRNLRDLDLFMNHFSGTVEFDKFSNLKQLTVLYLSYNQLSLLFNEISANATFPKFQELWLSSCNLSKFPGSLRNQDELEYLVLSENNLHGQVPEWMLSVGKDSLQLLVLAYNFLTGFAQQPIFPPWTRLVVLDLRSNLLQGSLPIPAISIVQFDISNNSLTGSVPELICNLSLLRVLDLSYNNLSGSLPKCFNSFSSFLSTLDLRSNKFMGSIPQSWTNGSLLKIVNFSQNRFQGQLPRSLAKCLMLKVLDLYNNQFNDSFPSWLENLPNLEVLILRSNEFNGPVRTSKLEYMFPNLYIIDISHNHFIGKLPLELLGNWKPTSFGNTNSLEYIHVNSTSMLFGKFSGYYHFSSRYNYSMTMTNKGQNIFFGKVLEFFSAIDMSSNGFSGEIPKGIKNLRGCLLLNLSNNMLTGQIPPSLGDLVELEALDLSQNELSGEIPSKLTKLTFLESFNISYNNLKGPIPQGNQFGTFEISSFEGNQDLCGTPLRKKCGNFDALPSPSSFDKEHEDCQCLLNFSWKIVVIGYMVGFVFGVMIGQIVIAKKRAWLMTTFGITRLI